jgi:two-component system, NtrC family, response regulator AtoC
MKGRLLIVDDDIDIRRTLGDRLESDGYGVQLAANGIEGLQLIRDTDPELVLLDLQMPELNGMGVLQALAEEDLAPTVVVITAYGSVDRAVGAMQAGAFDFIAKPFDPERIRVVVEKALGHERLRRDSLYWREQTAGSVPDFVSRSPQMEAVVAMARKAADSRTTVLLQGESGTGKGVLARAMHRWSPRHRRPFISVNCVALPENLLESELFGHEKGAFTGADRRRKGRFEAAHGGTILLDEIGATQPALQLKLLQVLQEGCFERVGGEHRMEVDVRVIAATNRDLRQAIAEGSFLEDLYYRLNVISLTLAPLRDRKEDIPVLAEVFLRRHAVDTKRPVTAISTVAMQSLCSYNWPGNVRELENTIERAVVLGVAEEIRPEDLADQVLAAGRDTDHGVKSGYHAAVEACKRQLIQGALAQTDGNQSRAADLLGVHRTYLSRLTKKLGLR